MYPRTYFETFMRYKAKDEVFVAMPFTDDFRLAFDRIIEPAIKRVTVNGCAMSARIINRGTSGAPDIHEQIFDAILHSRLVIADMTVQASVQGRDGSVRWQPNANVAYEVGLAAAWRNPEDVLLVHQGHPAHTYSFDVQNLRHVQYDLARGANAIDALAQEIVTALNQSRFLATRAYQRLLGAVSPSAIQFMHQEAPQRAFPVIVFNDRGMPVMDARIHAATELLSNGALKNRNVLAQGGEKGVAVIYEWTELGIRILQDLHAIKPDRARELRSKIASVPAGELPPEVRGTGKPAATEKGIDMVEAANVELPDKAVNRE